MALLQISEPGMSTAPHQHRLAVGIDLGTTNSLVATVRSGLPVVLGDEAGRTLVPSVVHYAADGAITVGDAAQPFGGGVDLKKVSVTVTRGRESISISGYRGNY